MSMAVALPAPVVEMIGVRRFFPGPPEVRAIKGIDLTIAQGEYLSIVGPSGSGKSTLLHLLGLLDNPTDGVYRLDGVDTMSLRERRRAVLRGQRIGFVFQSFHLLEHRTVLENVALSMVYVGVPRRERLARARVALERVGLAHRMEFAPTTLSGGERQRVAIARALVAEPSLLLADEPTGNLDSLMARQVLDLLEQINEMGTTVILVTHDPELARRARRNVHVVDGQISDFKAYEPRATAAGAAQSAGGSLHA
jgi:putative ABC transport system ATP-binding protein